jgi:hypothetical protein
MLRAMLASALFLVAATPPVFAQDTTPSTTPERVRVCSAVVPNNWRMAMPVNDNWLADDCMYYAISVGATHYQLGCIFRVYTGGPSVVPGSRPQKFSWGALAQIGQPRDGNIVPVPTCGWRR